MPELHAMDWKRISAILSLVSSVYTLSQGTKLKWTTPNVTSGLSKLHFMTSKNLGHLNHDTRHCLREAAKNRWEEHHVWKKWRAAVQCGSVSSVQSLDLSGGRWGMRVHSAEPLFQSFCAEGHRQRFWHEYGRVHCLSAAHRLSKWRWGGDGQSGTCVELEKDRLALLFMETRGVFGRFSSKRSWQLRRTCRCLCWWLLGWPWRGEALAGSCERLEPPSASRRSSGWAGYPRCRARSLSPRVGGKLQEVGQARSTLPERGHHSSQTTCLWDMCTPFSTNHLWT